MTNNENKKYRRTELSDKLNAIAKSKGWRDYTDLFLSGGFEQEIENIIETYALQQSQSALGERDFIIQKKDEIIESQKQTFDSLLKKYEAIDKEYGETIEKLSEKFESSLTTKDKEIEKLSKNDTIWREEHSKLAKEIEELREMLGGNNAPALALVLKNEQLEKEVGLLNRRNTNNFRTQQHELESQSLRIKELEEGLKKIRGIIFLDNYKNPMNNTDMYNICESLLSPSKEQKEGIYGCGECKDPEGCKKYRTCYKENV